LLKRTLLLSYFLKSNCHGMLYKCSIFKLELFISENRILPKTTIPSGSSLFS
jgi:hypothetical protein